MLGDVDFGGPGWKIGPVQRRQAAMTTEEGRGWLARGRVKVRERRKIF